MADREELMKRRAKAMEEYALGLATSVNTAELGSSYAKALVSQSANLFTVAASLRARANGGGE